MALDQALESLLRRDRLLVIASLVGITVLAWIYLFSLASSMNMPDGNVPVVADMSMNSSSMSDMSGDMSGMNMAAAEITQLRIWTLTDALFTFSMWAVMMVGMMSPSATPVILLYARVFRQREVGGQPFAPTGAFFAGYIVVWVVFSAGATALQWGFERLALLSPMLVSISPILSGAFLLVAGVYQWTPTKRACLRYCRSPVDFLSRHWRKEVRGAFLMGLEHGKYCLGCCWALMLLLFVGGVMNLLWLAAIALIVLIEKVVPFGRLAGQIGGAALVLTGLVILV